MAYDEDFAARVRELAGPGVTEKRMFGGLALSVGGHMAVVVSGRDLLMVRVGHEDWERLQDEPGVTATIMRGRPMRGWLDIDPSASATDGALRRWVDLGMTFTRSLPPK